MQLFEYAFVLEEKRDKDGEITDEAKVIVAPTHVMARDAAQATLIAARAIPEEYLNGKLDRVQVAVRPF